MRHSIVAIGIVLAGLSGCVDPPYTSDNNQIYERVVEETNDSAVRNAIISQHTLYPYHFVVNTARLNDLGLRDISVLAGYYRDNPGQLNLRKMDASPELYDARIKAVLAQLTKSGLDVTQMTVVDDLPGGSGMSSERAVRILSQEDRSAAQGGGSAGNTPANFSSPDLGIPGGK